MRSAPLVILLAAICGCSTFRGIPTHGGGKRFDEEQRAVAGAVRQAVEDVVVPELAGKSVQVTIDAMAHTGGGSIVFPGLNSLSANYIDQEVTETVRGTDSEDREGWSFTGTLPLTPDFRPTVFTSDADLKYLEAALLMKLRCRGVAPVTKSPEYLLFVLVDVFGTNRSRQESLLAWRDRLKASCELTYYAVKADTNEVLFYPRRASAEAVYEERSLIAFSGIDVQRSIEAVEPSPFPTAGPDGEAAAPVGPAETPEADEGEAMSPEEIRRFLDQKVKQADAYVQSGNVAAAERLVNEVRTVDPNFPGLDGVAGRLENLKATLARPK